MSQKLKDIWDSSPKYFEDKTLLQILGIIGNGKLTDDRATSREFKELLNSLPTNKLEEFINECLTTAGENSNRALQDLVNEIGMRLGFDVEFGRYIGKKNNTNLTKLAPVNFNDACIENIQKYLNIMVKKTNENFIC